LAKNIAAEKILQKLGVKVPDKEELYEIGSQQSQVSQASVSSEVKLESTMESSVSQPNLGFLSTLEM